jgi:hypothetical protein
MLETATHFDQRVVRGRVLRLTRLAPDLVEAILGTAAVRGNYAGRADDVVSIVLEGPETSLLLTSLPAANFH